MQGDKYKSYHFQPHTHRYFCLMAVYVCKENKHYKLLFLVHKCGQYKQIEGPTDIKVSNAKLLHAVTLAKRNRGKPKMRIITAEEMFNSNISTT